MMEKELSEAIALAEKRIKSSTTQSGADISAWLRMYKLLTLIEAKLVIETVPKVENNKYLCEGANS